MPGSVWENINNSVEKKPRIPGRIWRHVTSVTNLPSRTADKSTQGRDVGPRPDTDTCYAYHHPPSSIKLRSLKEPHSISENCLGLNRFHITSLWRSINGKKHKSTFQSAKTRQIHGDCGWDYSMFYGVTIVSNFMWSNLGIESFLSLGILKTQGGVLVDKPSSRMH